MLSGAGQERDQASAHFMFGRIDGQRGAIMVDGRRIRAARSHMRAQAARIVVLWGWS